MALTVRNIEWLAGFLDGEGCFYKNRTNAKIQIAQKDPWPLLKVQQIMGGRLYNVKGSIVGSGRRYHALHLTGRRAIGVMMTVYSLLSPRRQAKIAEIIGQWRAARLRTDFKNTTHCRRGHEYTDATTYFNPNKHKRECRVCGRASQKKYEDKKRLQKVPLQSVHF